MDRSCTYADGECYRDWTFLRNGLWRSDLAAYQLGAHHDLCQLESIHTSGTSQLRKASPHCAHLVMRQDDVVYVLAELSPTSKAVKLSSLVFLDRRSYGVLLNDMRSILHWHERFTSMRIYGLSTQSERLRNLLCRVEENDFLGRLKANAIQLGIDILRDPSVPTYDRPNVDDRHFYALRYSQEE